MSTAKNESEPAAAAELDPATRSKINFIQSQLRQCMSDDDVLKLLQANAMNEVSVLKSLFRKPATPSKEAQAKVDESAQQSMFKNMRRFYNECIDDFIRDNPESHLLTQTGTNPEWWVNPTSVDAAVAMNNDDTTANITESTTN